MKYPIVPVMGTINPRDMMKMIQLNNGVQPINPEDSKFRKFTDESGAEQSMNIKNTAVVSKNK